jgi:hypothetical protein
MAVSTPNLRVLDEIAIETPCLVPWGEIRGAGQVRACQVCRKNVFDLIELPTVDAAQILTESDTLPCVRICRAPDGRIVTADNPTGLGIRIWRGLRRRSGWAASLFALLFLPGCGWLNSCFVYGAPARSIKPTDAERSISDGSARPKVDTAKNAVPTE